MTQVPIDPALTQLTTALDVHAMARVFEPLFCCGRQGRARALGVDLVWTKYRPGESCRFSYRLRIRCRSTAEDPAPLLFARIYPPASGAAAARYQAAIQQPLIEPRHGPAAFYIPELEMVGWSFPNDRKLPHLPRLIDPASVERDIAPKLDPYLELRQSPRKWRLSLVHYVPERSCSVRLDVLAPNRMPRESKVSREAFYGKAYAQTEARLHAWRLMQALWRSDTRGRGEIALARPVLAHTPTQTLWQTALPGRTLFEQGMRGRKGLAMLRDAGRAVAALHSTPLLVKPTISRVSQADSSSAVTELAAVEAAAKLVLCVRPRSAPCLAGLMRDLARGAVALRQEPLATLHGDLHLKNLLACEPAPGTEGPRVSFIDLDTAQLGPPCKDLGSFIAALHFHALLAGESARTLRSRIEAFLEGYVDRGSWQLDRRALAWYTARSLLVERAARCVTRLKSGRLHLVDKLVRRAVEIGGAT